MFYSSLPLSSKLFKFTALSVALSLAGCGGGGDDGGTDILPPKPDLNNPGTGDNGNSGDDNGDGEEQTPVEEPDFFLQKLTVSPNVIELTDEETVFTVTVKAVQTATSAAMINKEVSLMVEGSESNGITIEGASTQVTDNEGNAVYKLKLNPQAVTDEAALLNDGFKLIATANKGEDDQVKQTNTVRVSKQGSGDGTQVVESELDISTSLATSSVSNNVLNVYGDTATLSVVAKNDQGARVKDVAVGLGIANVKGVAIIGGSKKVTDTNGLATFTIQVDDKLSDADRAALVDKTIAYTINIAENSGATKETTGEFKAALPISDYAISVTTSPSRLSAYGDSQTIVISATAKNTNVPTTINGATATINLNDAVTGVSLNADKVTLNAQGQANVTLNIANTVSADDRKTLIEKGISYTVVLTEPNRSTTTKTATSAVYLPAAEYKINFNESSKKQLSSSGGSAVISFRVNDKRGGIIAGQKVTASLPKSLAEAGLLTLQNNSEQTTDSNGEVSYTVRVPNNLTAAQKIKLENAGLIEKTDPVVLTATIVEDSGVPSSVTSEIIRIGSEIGQSDIQLSAQSLPATVSALAQQFKLQVAGKRENGSAAVGRTVKLVLDQTTSSGITILGNEIITNSSGIAEFDIAISKNLTPTQRENLIKSGISYTAVITDEDGTQSRLPGTIKVEQPETSIQFASIATPSISEFGGDGNINVKLTTKDSNAKPVTGKNITIQLGAKALSYGVTVTQSATTDFSGNALFAVNIPSNLTAAQRADLKKTGVNYQLSYVENGIVYNSAATKVTIITPAVSLSLLNATNNIDNQAGYILNNVGSSASIQAQLNDQDSGEQIANQPIRLEFANKSLAGLLTVNGQIGSSKITATTSANGLVSFDVVVPNDLNAEQKAALNKAPLTAIVTETLTGKEQQVKIKVQSMASAISLLSTSSKALNLNGGETQIEVIAKDSKGNVVTGQKVFLALPATAASNGVTLVSGGSQTTDDSGKAIFTLAVPNNLTDKQKQDIGGSFVVGLSAADTSGNITAKSATVNTQTPDITGTQESLTIGANKVVNTKGDTFKVFVRLKDNEGSIADRVVRLNVDNPVETGVSVAANGTATTNSDGVATFDLTLEPGANVNQAILEKGIGLTATTTTTENIELVQSYIVAVDTATIDNYQILVSADKVTLNTGGDQTNATFRVTDSSGGVLANVPVQLSIENLESSGAALTTPSVVSTDAQGKIDVGILLAANTVDARLNHSVVINAKIITPRYDANGDVTLQVREEKSLSLSAIGTSITLEASETQLKDGESTTISTTLVDGAGIAIANADIELVNAAGEVISTEEVITNASGEASFEINESDLTFDNNGNLRVFVRALGTVNTQRSLTSIDLVKVSQAGISFIDIEDVYDVNKQQTINVQIRADSAAQAQALIGETLEVQTTLGQFKNGNGSDNVILTRRIRATDVAENIITIPVRLRSELAGTTVLEAKVLGIFATGTNSTLKYQTTIDTRFRATTPAKMLFQAVKSVITPGTSTEVVATVKDENDVPVEGQTVVFSRVSDSSAGRLSAATAVTDSRGEARVVYQANASSPIGGVIINARLLQDDANIGSKTTNITVSEEAVYTTLAFANKLSSDDIYYTVRGSISVMDGSGRAVADQEVSIKSYATEYAQGVYCLLNSTTTYQAADIDELDEFGNVIQTTTPEPQVFSEKTPVPLRSDWYPTEDANYNYILDQDSDPILNEDRNLNGTLEAINPVTIIGGTLSDDGYSFVTDDEGRADFEIRYPLRYSNWVKVRFDASTFVNGSENTQSINFQLPVAVDDLSVSGDDLITPWIGNTSPFGDGGARCANSLSVTINENESRTRVTLSPYSPNYNVTINGQSSSNQPNAGFNTYIIDFNQAFELGSTVSVNRNGFGFSKVIKLSDN
ncbi:Ig-like domain-containing protein [uncultured Psychrobacter sp.]|uniref:beta strand repeat-containing protein n=1 Tax=uncultured Psychrobacter sp. TaxID=259303 RepID=UPI0026236B29|nr:Ig-like domain-containing protein [uncultured Psychrobacter sp.]